MQIGRLFYFTRGSGRSVLRSMPDRMTPLRNA